MGQIKTKFDSNLKYICQKHNLSTFALALTKGPQHYPMQHDFKTQV